MSTRFSVDSLDHHLSIKDGHLFVGCQKITKEDAINIAKFITDNHKAFDLTPKVKLGVWYRTGHHPSEVRMFIRTHSQYMTIDKYGQVTLKGHKSLESLVSVYDIIDIMEVE